MVTKGNAYFLPREICPLEYEDRLFIYNPKKLIFGVFRSENSENISLEIFYSVEAKRKFILLVFIVLVSYLCYKLGFLDIIETALANLITALIIFLMKSPNH